MVSLNYLYQICFQLVSILTPFITTPYISRVFNAEILGKYNYVLSYVSYFVMIASLGLNNYGQREIARVSDKTSRTKLFKELFTLRCTSYFVVFIIYFVCFCIESRNAMLNRLFVVHIIASLIDVTWFFQGVEDFKTIAIRGTAVKIAGVVLIFAFVRTEDDFYRYVCILLGTNTLGNAFMWRTVSKHLTRVKTKVSFYSLKPHLRGSLVLFIPQLSIQVYAVLDKTLLGLLSGDAEVGYYSQSEKIIKIAVTVLTALGTVLMPRITKLFSLHNEDEAKTQINRGFVFVLTLAIPMMVGIIVIAEDFIPFFLGTGYAKSIPVMKILSVLCVAMGISGITGPAILVARKKDMEYTISVASGMIINVFFNIFLIPQYAAYGAAIATIIAESVVTGMQCYYSRDILDTRYIIRGSLRAIVLVAPMSLVIIILKNIAEWEGILCLALICIGCLIYGITVFILFRNRIPHSVFQSGGEENK